MSLMAQSKIPVKSPSPKFYRRVRGERRGIRKPREDWNGIKTLRTLRSPR